MITAASQSAESSGLATGMGGEERSDGTSRFLARRMQQHSNQRHAWGHPRKAPDKRLAVAVEVETRLKRPCPLANGAFSYILPEPHSTVQSSTAALPPSVQGTAHRTRPPTAGDNSNSRWSSCLRRAVTVCHQPHVRHSWKTP